MQYSTVQNGVERDFARELHPPLPLRRNKYGEGQRTKNGKKKVSAQGQGMDALANARQRREKIDLPPDLLGPVWTWRLLDEGDPRSVRGQGCLRLSTLAVAQRRTGRQWTSEGEGEDARWERRYVDQ